MVTPPDSRDWERGRCAALGDEGFGVGEAGGLQFLAKFGLDFVDVLGAVLVGET